MTRSLAHRAWRQIPQSWRQKFFEHLTPVIAPRPSRNPKGGMPIGIAGWFSSASGLGEGARLGYRALASCGLEPSAYDLSAAFRQNNLPNAIETKPLRPGTGGSLIVHINGPYLPLAMCVLGRQQVADRRIIGYWAWELPRLSNAWRPALPFVHEIWVPSRFTQAAVVDATILPVHVVPHPLPEVKAYTAGRQTFGLPDDALIVLNSFHIGSNFARKNPVAAIRAFRNAFGDRRDRILVIKLSDPGNVPWVRRELDAAIAGASNIRIIEHTLSPSEMTALMALADIVISTHRSEGFGLICAEAMQLGKPVIATGWSGNLDFMNESNSALLPYRMIDVDDPDNAFDSFTQQWADPDVDAATEWLKRLADDPQLRQQMGAKAASDIADYLSPARFTRTVSTLLASGRKP